MREETKGKVRRKLANRMAIMILLALLQILFYVVLIRFFRRQAGWVEIVLRIASVALVLGIIKNSRHLSSDMMWIVLIILLPVPGAAAYLLLGADMVLSRTYRNLIRETRQAQKYYVQDPAVERQVQELASGHAGQLSYLSAHAHFPVYRNTGFTYYRLGEEGFPAMLEALKEAERFIFLEYFIIEEGQMWDAILTILREKAAAGVEVRVMYDDMGSISTLPINYAEELEGMGIKCVSFNRLNPVINIIMNHRDHRKILVIDGETAFTGGINLADEYINRKRKYGHWKDNCCRVTGEAVWSFTVLFLTNWNALRHEDSDFERFRGEVLPGVADGFIAPYGDTPLDDEITGQDIYMNILNQAQRYCYIVTPYLIIDTELGAALALAAKRGVDVRIVTPGVPDKRLIYAMTRSYYRQLIEAGVKIIEYTPGFVHGKVFVCDDVIATVGTINLDYRSLYLHFENGCYLYGVKEVSKIRDDVLATQQAGHAVTLREARYGLIKEFVLSAVRLFAPLM